MTIVTTRTASTSYHLHNKSQYTVLDSPGLLIDSVVLMLNCSKKKPTAPETLLKKKKQRAELLQKRVKTAALFRQVCKLLASCQRVSVTHAGADTGTAVEITRSVYKRTGRRQVAVAGPLPGVDLLG